MACPISRKGVNLDIETSTAQRNREHIEFPQFLYISYSKKWKTFSNILYKIETRTFLKYQVTFNLGLSTLPIAIQHSCGDVKFY